MEKLIEEKLPNSGLKASPHIELRVKTLKIQFNAIMDMLTFMVQRKKNDFM